MIKSELITQLANKLPHFTEKDVASGINSILESMSDALANGDRVEIRGFGSFSLHFRPKRNAHNPRTGAKVETEEKYVPHFKPGKQLRESVNASKDTTPIIVDEREVDDEF